jgi:hypothetical protein
MVVAAAEGRTNLLIFVEPPSADPHARWCGEGARQRASLPDFWHCLSFVGDSQAIESTEMCARVPTKSNRSESFLI